MYVLCSSLSPVQSHSIKPCLVLFSSHLIRAHGQRQLSFAC